MVYYRIDWLNDIELWSAIWASFITPVPDYFSMQKFWIKVALKGNAILSFAYAKHGA